MNVDSTCLVVTPGWTASPTSLRMEAASRAASLILTSSRPPHRTGSAGSNRLSGRPVSA